MNEDNGCCLQGSGKRGRIDLTGMGMKDFAGIPTKVTDIYIHLMHSANDNGKFSYRPEYHHQMAEKN